MKSNLVKLAIHSIVTTCAAYAIFSSDVGDSLIGYMILDLVAFLSHLMILDRDKIHSAVSLLIAKVIIRLMIERFLWEGAHLSLALYDTDWLGKCLRDTPENRERMIVDEKLDQCDKRKARLMKMMATLEEMMEHGKINEGEYVSMAKEISNLYAQAEIARDYALVKYAIRRSMISADEATTALANITARMDALE
jgi:hypothetical protein